MALQLAFTKQGIPHPAGYWKAAVLNLDYAAGCGIVWINAYHDKDARTDSATANVIDTRIYQVGPAQFATYFAGKADPVAQCYTLAKATPEPGTDKSFFADATDV